MESSNPSPEKEASRQRIEKHLFEARANTLRNCTKAWSGIVKSCVKQAQIAQQPTFFDKIDAWFRSRMPHLRRLMR